MGMLLLASECDSTFYLQMLYDAVRIGIFLGVAIFAYSIGTHGFRQVAKGVYGVFGISAILTKPFINVAGDLFDDDMPLIGDGCEGDSYAGDFCESDAYQVSE